MAGFWTTRPRERASGRVSDEIGVHLGGLDRPHRTIARTAHEKNRKRLEERATANRLRPDWSENDQSGLPPGPAA